MNYSIKGSVWKFGDNIDTDIIMPARYLNIIDVQKLVQYLFEPVRPGFGKTVKKSDIIVAGDNFGCGSSREHAPAALKAAGIDAIIARSFARIFYRNAFNIGLMLICCPEAVDALKENDCIRIDIESGQIYLLGEMRSYQFAKPEKLMLQLIRHNGLMNFFLNAKEKHENINLTR